METPSQDEAESANTARLEKIEALKCSIDRAEEVDLIDVSELPERTTIHRDGSSSLGILDTLSNEVLGKIFEGLDFQSLSRVAQVSIRGKGFVESMPQYCHLMEHASDALAALSRTKLITEFSAALLYQTLRSEACCSCGQYGRLLHLPTCSRCCWFCMIDNPALWVMPVALAAQYFELSLTQLEALPIMHTIPKVAKHDELLPYWTHHVRRARTLRINGLPCIIQSINSCPPAMDEVYSWTQFGLEAVNVGAAQRLSRLIHGENHQYNRRKFFSTSESEDIEEGDLRGATLENYFRCLESAWLEPCDADPMTRRRHSPQDQHTDEFSGTSAIAFPSLLSLSGPEYGICCGGCRYAEYSYQWGDTPVETCVHLSGIYPEQYYENLSSRAMSRAGFLEHIRTCPGALKLLSDDEEYKSFIQGDLF